MDSVELLGIASSSSDSSENSGNEIYKNTNTDGLVSSLSDPEDLNQSINDKINQVLKYFNRLLSVIVSTSDTYGDSNNSSSSSTPTIITGKKKSSNTPQQKTLKRNRSFLKYEELPNSNPLSDEESNEEDNNNNNIIESSPEIVGKSTVSDDEELFYKSTDLKIEIQKLLIERSILKKDEIYLALSVIQDRNIVDDIINQHINHFIESCYHEIINRFQYHYPRVIDMIKILRVSPDFQFKLQMLNSSNNGNGQLPLLLPTIKSSKSLTDSAYDNNYKSEFSFKIFLSKFINSIHPFQYNYLSMIPITQWLGKYKLGYLKDDIISSLTVGFMIIPQAMAYAMLAGLPPIYGLYSAFICPIVYGIFGTSNEISVGPVAMVSLLIPSVIDLPFNHPNYVVEVICLSLVSGLVLLLIGLLQAGFIIENLLSNPILMGFMQAASILIMCSQLKNLTSIPINSHTTTIIQFIQEFIEHITSIHGYTVLLGLSSIAILILFKQINTRLVKYKVPIAVIMLLLGTLISYLINAKEHGIKIVDEIPSGLPKPILVPLTLERFSKIIIGGVIISILGFVESMSIAKKLSSLRKYSISPNQELLALGMANIIGSMFTACPATGSFSRTIVAYQTGSKSRLTSILSGILVGFVLLFLTPIFKHTPLCILSSIVIAAAVSLFEIKDSIDLFKKGEILGFFELIFVFLITLLLGSEIGIVVAFVVSILHIIYFSSKPQLVTLGRIPGTLVFRNIQHYPDARVYPGIKILRYDSRLTYYTVNNFRDNLYQIDIDTDITNNKNIIIDSNNNDSNTIEINLDIDRLKVLIIDMVNVSSIDSTAIDVLNEIIEFYHNNHIQILLSDLKLSVKTVLYRSGFFKNFSESYLFNSTHLAVEYFLSKSKK